MPTAIRFSGEPDAGKSACPVRRGESGPRRKVSPSLLLYRDSVWNAPPGPKPGLGANAPHVSNRDVLGGIRLRFQRRNLCGTRIHTSIHGDLPAHAAVQLTAGIL